MCRKLETEEEKVLPFYASSLTQEEQDDVEVIDIISITRDVTLNYFRAVFFIFIIKNLYLL